MSLPAITIGLDEVGRGALAGPVVVGIVSLDGLDSKVLMEGLEKVLKRKAADSKKLTRLQRERAADYLKERVIWDIGEAEAEEVDKHGIVGAVMLAADRAMSNLQKQGYAVKNVLSDAGLHHSYEKVIPTEHVVKGDEKITEIMLASIIAKVYRDALMRELAEAVPVYGWERNAGYGSANHLAAIGYFGAHPKHRKTFLRK